MTKTKRSLILSVVSMLLCLVMLVGSTFAWFTDSVTSGKNVIVSGNLDVELEYLNAEGEWESVEGKTNLFDQNALWEPGHTEVVYLRVSNLGTLALKYSLGVNIVDEIGSVNVLDKEFKLSDYIEFGAVNDVETPYADRAAARADVKSATLIREGYTKPGSINAGDPAQYVALVVYMPETVGNEANYKTGCAVPKIELGVTLVATQMTTESDDFGPDYDQDATFPGEFKASAPVSVTEGAVSKATTVGEESGIHAQVPAGVKVAEGTTELSLSVKPMKESEANVTLNKGESSQSLDVHMEGVAEDNTVPMLITLEGLFSAGLNSTSVKMYHVEDGVTVEMTQVTTPVNHNEFSYDPATGDVVMAVASFSEYVTVEDNWNPWEGKAVTDWYNDTATEFTLTTAEQLAGLGVLVDGGNDFSGKTIKLGADINLYGTDDSGNVLSFNPIGFKYPGATDDAGNDISKIFRGTFDGQGYAIKNLYQNGWELGLSYSNAGGGLFAGVQNATFKNLTMQGADIVMEAVPMGTVAAYAYGTCTFKDIRVTDSTLQNYNWNIGGIVGGVNGTHTFSNIYVDNTVTLSELWGSFDGGIGGIVGDVYGGNNGSNSITMTDIEVACVMDVYNDVTSAYQWYAYRGAGMLIGNTDEPGADGKNAKTAAASFLICTNVKVYYGDWVNYTYCQFTNQSNDDGSVDWQNNYPWVREQAGLSNPSYSNPRYGHPIVNGTAISSAEHTHAEGDQCGISIPFNQLYGGGQGVYGQPEHKGVTVASYAYTITYMQNGKVLDVVYVGDNTVAQSTTNATAQSELTVPADTEFAAWVNAGSTVVAEVAAGNTENVTLYPSWAALYTARWVDEDGNVIHEETFTTNTTALSDVAGPASSTDVLEFDHWEVRNADGTSTALSGYNISSATGDITLYPYYNVKTDGTESLGLTGVDEDGDGKADYYTVEAVAAENIGTDVTIPGNINGVPVKVITDLSGGWASSVENVVIQEGVEEINAQAFGDTQNLKTVELPSTITKIDNSAFAGNLSNIGSIVGYAKVLTITYNGTRAQWDAVVANSNKDGSQWEDGLAEGTTVTCTDGVYTLTDKSYDYGTGYVYTWTWTPNENA